MATNAEWIISIQHKLSEQQIMSNNKNNKRCIYKVPVWLKDQVCDGNDTTPYTPEIVSFGPYHRGDPELAEMEKHKWRCLSTMLTREKQDVKPYLDEMRKLEEETRACYQGLIELNSNDFVEMLVLDGCFMLEFLRVRKLVLNNLNYDEDDPVFSKETLVHVIGREMIKLQNQLPTMVLEKLLAVQYNQPIRNNKHIPKLVLRALAPIWVTNEVLTDKQLRAMRNAVAADRNNNMILHCLDIFRASLLYKPPLNLEGQGLFKVEDGVELRDVATPRQIKTRVDDILVLDQEEQHDQEMGQGSVEDVSVTNNGLHASDRSLDLDVLSESPESYSFVSSSSSSLDQPKEQHIDIEKKTRITSCVADVLKKVMNCGRRPKPSYEQIRANSELMVYCVEDLREAGVKFKTHNSQLFWDLAFDKQSGLLEIPPIKIDDATKTVFLNLIAYEQCHLRHFREMCITDYVAFMDKLVNSGADVRHLHQAGIIVHQLGSDAEVADLFNRLVKKAFVDWEQGGLSDLYEQLNKYCTHRRHRWCANLQHEYLKNPMVIISIAAAIFLFLITVVQTFYTVFAYHRPPK